MSHYQYYPKNRRITEHLEDVVGVFDEMERGTAGTARTYKSNEVLAMCRPGLEELSYRVEDTDRETDKYIEVPVLFGRNNRLEKSFRADAYNSREKSVIEVEAGRGVLNNQFLKDLFQACMMQDVDYLTIAVLYEYRTGKEEGKYRVSRDFEIVCKFFDALYSSDRLQLPLKGILIVGYESPHLQADLPSVIDES